MQGGVLPTSSRAAFSFPCWPGCWRWVPEGSGLLLLRGVWTRWCLWSTSSLSPSTLVWIVPWLPKLLWPWFAKAVYPQEGEGSSENLKLLRAKGSGCHWGGTLVLHPKSGQMENHPIYHLASSGNPLVPAWLSLLCLLKILRPRCTWLLLPVDWWVSTCLPCPSHSPLVLFENDLCLAHLSLPFSHSVSYLIHQATWSPCSFLKLSCSAS